MYEVLLVDDEALARNDVKSMLSWEEHGFVICGEAQHGEMALAMMEQHLPHIAIIDVSMPNMDGVELCRRIKERFAKVKMIMLSSFDDYDYVRSCLMNGAMDYLLKHRLNGEALVSLLNKAVQELQSEEREHEARSAQTRMMESLSPVMLREHVANVTREGQEAGDALQEFVRQSGVYAGAVTYGTAVVQIVPFLLVTERLTDVQKNEFVHKATEVMQLAVGDVQKRTVGYVGEGRFIVLFSFTERSERAVMTQMKQAMSALSHTLEKFLNLHCIFTVGSLCGSLRQVAVSYRKADQEMTAMYAQGLHAPMLRETLFHEERKQLLLYLEQLDLDKIVQLLTMMFAEVRTLPAYAIKVQMMVSELLHGMEMTLKRQFAHISPEEHELVPSRNEIARLRTVSELAEWMIAYYTRVTEVIKKQQVGGPYSRHIAKAVQYITDHYAANISLDSVAGALNLNPSYLSRLFKEETGMTFTEYLNRLRIQKSCLHMEAGALALKQISSEVGFVSYTYFFKVFKTITGTTPQAYIDLLKQSKL
ncbi:response regulator [Paenibacillus oryzisoli]|uniref:response regulator transcription factor n=1 Tax=Paenibacillus oryzisoli TaxID=1850517 RepID=UPI003D2D6449